MGMSHILGDSNPLEPEKGCGKAWAYLKELGKYVEYYPTGTAITLKEFAQGQRWMIAGIMEWDMKPRAESVIPPDSKITILRSEEHTSELQSRRDLVCRLLLEKKNN